MSASEKLKGLIPLGSTYGGPAEAAVMRALPQIVAVVEAAERLKIERLDIAEGWQLNFAAAPGMHAALADLDEALT